MQTVGTFCLIKNERPWIEAHLRSWLPHVDEMVFFDGNSTDGTLEILREYAKRGKIKLFEDKDPKDLQGDYVRLSNNCIRSLTTNYAIFAHPDMVLAEPGNIRELGDSISYTSHMQSFAGEPGAQLYEIIEGRGRKWKNIFRLRNPDLGCHYHGFYGSAEEDCYFSHITGDEHRMKWENGNLDLNQFPYCIKDSGLRILHYSDVRRRDRRIDRMVKCLLNNNCNEAQARLIIEQHPRITFQNGNGFRFVAAEYPDIFKEVVR